MCCCCRWLRRLLFRLCGRRTVKIPVEIKITVWEDYDLPPGWEEEFGEDYLSGGNAGSEHEFYWYRRHWPTDDEWS